MDLMKITVDGNTLIFTDHEGDEIEFDLVQTALGHKTFKTEHDAALFKSCALDAVRIVQEDFTLEELRHDLAELNVMF